MRMILNKEESCSLAMLEPGSQGRIEAFDFGEESGSFFLRLLEVGFLPGENIEVLNVSPYGGDPISVRVKDAVYAIRKQEAGRIRVKRLST